MKRYALISAALILLITAHVRSLATGLLEGRVRDDSRGRPSLHAG